MTDLPPEAAQRALEYTSMDHYQLARRAFIAERTLELLREIPHGHRIGRSLVETSSQAREEWGGQSASWDPRMYPHSEQIGSSVTMRLLSPGRSPISRAVWWSYTADRLASLHRRVSSADFQRDDDRVRQGQLLLTLDRAIAQATGKE